MVGGDSDEDSEVRHRNVDSADETTHLLRDVQPADEDDEEVQLVGCAGTAACDPRRALHRYLILIIMCFLSFGSYFCYDNPAALEDQMQRDMSISTGNFMSLYAWYSWPNVIVCWFGGILIDRVLGLRLGTIVFALLVTAGQVVFALGAFVDKFWVMQIGRIIFGLGGESLCVAQNTYAVSWFKGKELNAVFGLQLSFSRAGSTVNMNVMEPLYQFVAKRSHGHICLGITLFIATAFCVFSLLCSFAMAYFDKRANRILKTETVIASDEINLKDMIHFPLSIWVLCVICVAYYVSVFPFIGLGLVFFESKFGLEPSSAGMVNSLVYIISAVASPVFGLCIDKTGKNIFWLGAGVIFTLACHATLCFTFINPYVPMSIMGLAYSIVASSLWPMVAIIVPEKQIGTAYGIMQSVQNLGLASVSLIAGSLVDAHGYLILEVFFMIWLCLAFGACTVLWMLDIAYGNGNLNRSTKERLQDLQRKQLMTISE